MRDREPRGIVFVFIGIAILIIVTVSTIIIVTMMTVTIIIFSQGANGQPESPVAARGSGNQAAGCQRAAVTSRGGCGGPRSYLPSTVPRRLGQSSAACETWRRQAARVRTKRFEHYDCLMMYHARLGFQALRCSTSEVERSPVH